MSDERFENKEYDRKSNKTLETAAGIVKAVLSAVLVIGLAVLKNKKSGKS